MGYFGMKQSPRNTASGPPSDRRTLSQVAQRVVSSLRDTEAIKSQISNLI